MAKLEQLAIMTPAQICNGARHELLARLAAGWSVPWVRFAALGAMPAPRDWRGTSIKALVALLSDLRDYRVPVHFPEASPARAKWYREQLGDLVTVRQSIQTGGVRAAGPVSMVAGKDIRGRGSRRLRLAAAIAKAKARTAATGRGCVVCPEQAWHVVKKTEAPQIHKCGEGGCTACADGKRDVVYIWK
jgi:hypothetical protein